MSQNKDTKRLARRNLKEARIILNRIEAMLNSQFSNQECMAEAFLHVLNWHMQFGDLHPSDVHLAALLRSNHAGK